MNEDDFSKLCLTPCEGVFADISKEPVEHFYGQSMKTILEAYESYKNFFNASPTYPVGISGFPFSIQPLIHVSIILDYQFKTNLKAVRIYFDTPTFDRILRVNLSFPKITMQ